jgi:hypothetical protein
MSNRVVAHFLDGRVLKGASFDVSLTKATCHVQIPTGPFEVRLSELKALFFVKDLTGDPARQEGRTIAAGDTRAVGGRRVEIRFRDSERLVGLTPSYQPDQQFFYVLPADSGSNNIRILINRAATSSVRLP